MSCLRFNRNGHACLVRFDEQTTSHWGFIGIEPGHELFGCAFIDTELIGLSKLSPPPEIFANETLMKKWWVGFQGGFDKKKVIDTLTAAVDEL